ncbi:MAG: RluA family pseudouridine synthase [Spirochaetaceae bacterium]|nr:RluA family pseudouridine synthase [Spirochaetaceae bacterium]
MVNPYEILSVDDDILVVNKLAPLPVLKDKTGDEDLQSLLKREHEEFADFLEAAHRIDRRTSGIVVFARNIRALQTLEKEFRTREIQKTYIACLEKEPVPPSGELRHTIIFDKRRNLSIALPCGDNAQGVLAEIHYSLISRSDRYFFVQVEPLTGRHHQIRAQFAATGCPIKGDLKYGARRSSPSGRIMLHAWKIAFPHPHTRQLISLTADFPNDETLWEVLKASLAVNPAEGET